MAASTVTSAALVFVATLAATAGMGQPASGRAAGRRLQQVVFTLLEGGACRTAENSQGTHATLRLEREECEEECRNQADCVAFEFNSRGGCEIHTETITQTSGVGSSECFIKSISAAPASEAPSASARIFSAESQFDLLLFLAGVAAGGYCLCGAMCFLFLRIRAGKCCAASKGLR
mmetsp:Transcript_93087/g.263104  ORF Transcript_93087/g.263104 Transcript_93087/m.263104 type:complete len:176 (-) Transcript_93087:297-824(-)